MILMPVRLKLVVADEVNDVRVKASADIKYTLFTVKEICFMPLKML